MKVYVCAIGLKALQFFRRLSGVELSASATHLGDRPHMKDLIGPIKVMLDLYREQKIDQLLLVHNVFVNTMTQKGTVMQLLPLQTLDKDELQERWDYIYEPDASEILDELADAVHRVPGLSGHGRERGIARWPHAWWP